MAPTPVKPRQGGVAAPGAGGDRGARPPAAPAPAPAAAALSGLSEAALRVRSVTSMDDLEDLDAGLNDDEDAYARGRLEVRTKRRRMSHQSLKGRAPRARRPPGRRGPRPQAKATAPGPEGGCHAQTKAFHGGGGRRAAVG